MILWSTFAVFARNWQFWPSKHKNGRTIPYPRLVFFRKRTWSINEQLLRPSLFLSSYFSLFATRRVSLANGSTICRENSFESCNDCNGVLRRHSKRHSESRRYFWPRFHGRKFHFRSRSAFRWRFCQHLERHLQHRQVHFLVRHLIHHNRLECCCRWLRHARAVHRHLWNKMCNKCFKILLAFCDQVAFLR